MNRTLGPLETQLFAYVQLRKVNTLKTGEVSAALKITPKQERELFSRLARSNLIAKVRRGLYLVPERLPLGGKWSPDEILALNTLMADRDGRYQICGPNAFLRYGWDHQVPARVSAYNNRLWGDRRIGSVSLSLIKVADRRLGNTEIVTVGDGLKAVYATRARSLLDAVYDWSRFNSLPQAYQWIQADLTAKRVTPDELVSVTLQYGDTGTIRRMGALMDRAGVAESLLKPLAGALSPSTSRIPWIPTKPKRGSFFSRWGVVMNEDA